MTHIICYMATLSNEMIEVLAGKCNKSSCNLFIALARKDLLMTPDDILFSSHFNMFEITGIAVERMDPTTDITSHQNNVSCPDVVRRAIDCIVIITEE